MREGRPVKTGWAALWRLRRAPNVSNAILCRSRTIQCVPVVYASAAIHDGAYALDVPYQDKNWYVVIEEPNQPITQVGPIAIDLNEQKKLDLASAAGGSISGSVQNVPKQWLGCLWAIAFTNTGINAEAPVDAAGHFNFKQLPPGEYGLKVGHDAYHDLEVPRGIDIPRELWNAPAEPWKRAIVVKVEADKDCSGVKLDLPAE